jgi:hypothetical protein
MDDFLQIGKTLLTTREERQLTVEDATRQTCIPAKIIRALESDDYSIFSSATYARSYLSQYSRLLEIDPSPWLDAFKLDAFKLDAFKLDAFKPAAFSREYHGFSIIDEVNVRNALQPANKPGGTRWVPSFLGIMIAAAVVYGGYRVIENFEINEKGMDTDKTAPVPRVITVADKTSVASNITAINRPGPTNEEALTDATLTAPPRAIILNEGDE